MKAKVQKARPKVNHQLNTVTLWIWKGDTHSSIYRTSNNTGDGSVSQMDKLLSEVLIHLEKSSQSKPIQVRPTILRYNFKNLYFFGPLIFHSLGPCIYYTDFHYFRLHAFMYV